MSIRPIKARTQSATPYAETNTINPPPRRRGTTYAVQPAAAPSPPRSSNWDADGNYIVGKGKPPVKTQFQKGRSGNPKGRPKSAKGVSTLVREVLGERLPVRTPHGQKHMNAVEIALNKLREQVAKGNIRAIEAVLKHWMQAVPDSLPESVNPAAPALSAADQQILDVFLAMLAPDAADAGMIRDEAEDKEAA